RAADWLLDLGPECGDAGGEVVAEGPPAMLARHPSSHTAAALRAYETALNAPAADIAAEPVVRYRALPPDAIEVRHAREHNLKNITVRIPRNRFTVITGMSGSGKSTLAFDILFNEGQRRYLESLNAYARQFVQPASRPDVDAIFGIPPTVAIEQRTSRGGRKSTVATLTELYHFLRLLYVKLGVQYCPKCDVPVTPQSFEAIAAQVMRDFRGRSVEVLAPLVTNRKGLYTDLAKWARGKGYPQLRVDGEYLPTAKWPRLDRFREHVIALPVGRIAVEADNEAALRTLLDEALVHGKDVVKVLDITDGERPDAVPLTFSTLRACPSCGTSFPEPDPRLFSFNSKHGWCESCYGTGLALGVKKVEDPDALEFAELDTETGEACPVCEGSRLNPVARAVRFHERPIHKLTGLPVSAVADFFRGLQLEGRDAEIARDIVTELASRLDFLQQVGLGYLALDRAAPTLSGGEAQRIRLAAQLGSSLTGVCYILDEPTIGLHPRDNRILLDTLAALEARGNTLVVVEHDEDTIRRADHVIDLGPGAGSRGGEIVAEGTADELAASPTSVTGRCLRDPLRHPLQPRRTVSEDLPVLKVEGAFLHNLKDVTASVPLARLTVVTGVSGSGKSTLARDVLLEGMKACLGHREERTGPKPGGRAGKVGRTTKSGAVDNSTAAAVAVADEVRAVPGCKALHGWRQVGRVLEVDQTPIGKTPRSCPATYVGFWDTIRKLFADTNEARMRGWPAARFSFNTGAGR
ncbi:MAG: excinuclease ABC subunit A, partial [Zoogloea sp.]|nr:excinuclease ABC subunit A [Zoogloea sp.]